MKAVFPRDPVDCKSVIDAMVGDFKQFFFVLKCIQVLLYEFPSFISSFDGFKIKLGLFLFRSSKRLLTALHK